MLHPLPYCRIVSTRAYIFLQSIMRCIPHEFVCFIDKLVPFIHVITRLQIIVVHHTYFYIILVYCYSYYYLFLLFYTTISLLRHYHSGIFLTISIFHDQFLDILPCSNITIEGGERKNEFFRKSIEHLY
jgi:hypothetical protein